MVILKIVCYSLYSYLCIYLTLQHTKPKSFYIFTHMCIIRKNIEVIICLGGEEDGLVEAEESGDTSQLAQLEEDTDT